MRIAFDGRYAQENLGGIGKYIKTLTEGLQSRGYEVVIFYSKKPRTKIKGSKRVILETTNRYFYEQYLIPRALKQYPVDLYHATGNVGIPFFSKTPSIVTIHDIIPLKISNYFRGSLFPQASRASYLFRTYSSCILARRVIATSNYVRNDIIKSLNINGNKIKVVYPGVSISRKKAAIRGGLEKNNYILNNGGIDDRKNIDSLIEAFTLIHKDFPSMKLVITGENKFLRPHLIKKVEDLGLSKNIVFTGYVNEEVLARLISDSACLCYPSLEEGFGLPILEGFSFSIPVVSSNTSSIPEIATNSAILVNPLSPQEIYVAIRSVITNKVLKNNLIIRGRERVKKFSWDNTVNRTIEIYNEIKQ